MLCGMADCYPPPPIETATDPIASTADMRQRWRALMGPLGFGQRLLWIGFVGPDRCMTKAYSQVPLGSGANPDLAGLVMYELVGILEGFPQGTTVALLLTWPGVGPLSYLDRQWASLLTDAADEHGVPLQPIFRANDESLVLVDATMEVAN